MHDNAQTREDKEAAYFELLMRNQKIIWYLCQRYSRGNRDLGRDLMQEVYLLLWLRLDEERPRVPEWLWVWWQVRAVLSSAMRGERVKLARYDDLMKEPLVDDDDFTSLFEEMEEFLTVDEACMLDMRRSGYTTGEIAFEFGISRNAVYKRMENIINKIRRGYGK